MTPCTLLINFYVNVRQNKHKGFSKIIPWQLKNTTTHHPFIFLFYAQIHRRKTSIFLYFPRWRNIPFHMSDPILTCISYFSQAIVCCQVIYKVLLEWWKPVSYPIYVSPHIIIINIQIELDVKLLTALS